MIADAPEPSPIWVTVDADASLEEVPVFLHRGRALRRAPLLAPPEGGGTGPGAQRLHPRGRPGWAPRIALDQEGGRVNRLSALGHDLPLRRRHGRPIRPGRSARLRDGRPPQRPGLRRGFRPRGRPRPGPSGTGLEGRVYADDPDIVTACCGAFLRGLAASRMWRVASSTSRGWAAPGWTATRAFRPWTGSREERRAHSAPYAALKDRAPYVMIAHGGLRGPLGHRTTVEPGTRDLRPPEEAWVFGAERDRRLEHGRRGPSLGPGEPGRAEPGGRCVARPLGVDASEHSLRGAGEAPRHAPFLARKSAWPMVRSEGSRCGPSPATRHPDRGRLQDGARGDQGRSRRGAAQALFLEAENGLDGFKLLVDHHVDLVLCDLVMPRMDGFKFLQLRASRPDLLGVPVIVLTAVDQVDQKIRLLSAGAGDYLTKPFHPGRTRGANHGPPEHQAAPGRAAGERTPSCWSSPPPTD